MLENTKKTILLVEDEALIAITEKNQLEQYGYAVKTVNTGEKAIEAVKTSSYIDLILMDINLGDGIDGTQAAAIILEEHDIPIVFVSSHSEREVVEKTEKITSYGYVVKNSSITVLDASIKMAFKLFDANNKVVQELHERKKMDEALMESEEQTRFILKHNPNAIAVFDNQMNLLIVSDRFLKDYDVENEDIIGKNLYEVFPELPEKWRIAHARALQGEILNNDDDFFIRPDGSITYTRWECRPWYHSDNRIGGMIAYTEVITERKLIEEALRESEERFDLAMNASNEGLFDWNLETNSIYYSPRWKSILGYEDHEIANDFSFWETATEPPDVKRSWELQQKLVTGQKERFAIEIKMKHKHGHWVDILIKAKAVFDKNEKAIRMVGTHTNITDRKRAEEALRENEKKYKNLHESIRDGVVFIDLSGAIISTNIIFQNMVGYTADELLSMNLRDITPAKWLAEEEALISKELNGKEYTDPYEKECRRKNGSICPVELTVFSIKDEDNSTTSLWAIVRDITERKKAEEALRESEAKFRAMVETFPLAIFQSVGVEQITEYMNPTMVKLFGYTQADIPSVAQWWPLAYPDETYRRQIADEWTKKVKHAIATQSPIEPMEVVCTCKDGSKKNISWGYITLGNKNYSCGLDITKRKKAEEEVQKQLTEKELILKEVHHRIKNNMNSISSLLFLQAQTVKEPSAIAVLEDARNRIKSMMLLYDKLYRSQDYTELSVKNYLSSLVDEVVANFPNSQLMNVEKDIQDFVLDVKRLQPLSIIINELLTNIMKYAFLGKERGLITVSVSNSDGHVMVSVQDDGIGVPESVSFENSTGFGLQIIYALAQQLGGSIRIERGNGARVVLEFDV